MDTLPTNEGVNMTGGGPDKPEKTAEQQAIEIRQRSLLDKEIEENEERFKLLARGKLGRQSLLSGAPRTPEESAGGGRRGGSGGAGSLLGGRSPGGGRSRGGMSGGGSIPSVRTPRSNSAGV